MRLTFDFSVLAFLLGPVRRGVHGAMVQNGIMIPPGGELRHHGVTNAALNAPMRHRCAELCAK